MMTHKPKIRFVREWGQLLVVNILLIYETYFGLEQWRANEEKKDGRM